MRSCDWIFFVLRRFPYSLEGAPCYFLCKGELVRQIKSLTQLHQAMAWHAYLSRMMLGQGRLAFAVESFVLGAWSQIYASFFFSSGKDWRMISRLNAIPLQEKSPWLEFI